VVLGVILYSQNPMAAPPRFTVRNKNYLLTYPQCPVDKAAIVGNCIDKSLPTEVLYYTACRELHQDGQPHVHVVLSYYAVFGINDCRFFDYTDDDGTVYHPSFEPVRSLKAILTYVAKDDDELLSTHPSITDQPETWASILAESGSRTEFLSRIERSFAKDFILRYDQIVSFSQTRFAAVEPNYRTRETHTEWIVPAALTDWVTNEFPVGNLSHSLSTVLFSLFTNIFISR